MEAVAVAEHPILFSASMVLAILEGRKTQTRRVVKTQPKPYLGYMMDYSQRYAIQCGEDYPDDSRDQVKCPYGVPGDKLWVREMWRPWGWREDSPITIQYRADMARRADTSGPLDLNYENWYARIAEQATLECERAGLPLDPDGCYRWESEDKCPLKWRPSIHLPRWGSRITLELTGVRVQRVQDITEADALAEGVEPWPFNPEQPMTTGELGIRSPFRGGFAVKWDDLNTDRGFTWFSNPWVWVLEFKLVSFYGNVKGVYVKSAD